MTKLQILKYLIKHNGDCREANRGIGVPYAFTCHVCPLRDPLCADGSIPDCPGDASVAQIAETMLKDMLADNALERMLKRKV